MILVDEHKPFFDPREQRVKADIIQHPRAPVTFDPPSLEETCAGCGLPTRMHWTISGVWLGCTDALSQRHPPRNPERWNDPRPGVTCAVRRALLTKCGPALEIFLSGLTHDEVLAIASQLARDAVDEYIRSLGK